MDSKNTTLCEVKVPVSDLKIGMYVSRLDKEWVDSIFLFQGFLIENEQSITQLRSECDYVYVDTQNAKAYNTIPEKKAGFSFKSLFGSSASKTKVLEMQRDSTNYLSDITERRIPTDNIVPPKKITTYEQELGFSKLTYGKTLSLMSEFSAQVKDGGTIDIMLARDAIYDCMTSMLRSPDAMQLVIRLKNKHHSSWQHSMNDSVLAISFGRYLNLHNDELIILGLCGLLHDIGNLGISKQAYQDAENKKQLIRSHTVLGRDILLNCEGDLAKTVAEVAYSHHERLDGSGFPLGLSGPQISPYTRMISIVTMYNTLTNNSKSEKEKLTHYDAISLMLTKANTHFDETLLNAFHQCIGTYPVGCVVEMNTGEIGMIVEVHEKLKLKPKVMLLTAPDKRPCLKRVIDLAKTELTSEGIPYIIKGIVQPENYGITL